MVRNARSAGAWLSIGSARRSRAQQPGDITVPGRKLLDIFRALPEKVSVALSLDGEKVTLKAGRSRFTLSSLSANEYPTIEEINAQQTLRLGQAARLHYNPRPMTNSVAATGRSFDADDFVGGTVAVDFVNSVDSWFVQPPPERFNSFADWLSWSAAARTLAGSELRSIERRAARDAHAARRALERVRAVRDALHGVLRARVERRSPGPRDLVLLSRSIAAAHAQRRLSYAGGTFVGTWNAGLMDLERPLWPVLLDAEALLLDSQALGRLNQCPAANCGWLFLDTSRNRSRRWCSMRTCGNLAKAHRHYARLRRARNARERK